MRLLLTGGTGFIGSRLALFAIAEHHEVVVTGLTNSNAERVRAAELKAAGITVSEGNLLDPQFTRSLVRDCDTVIHLAAAQHEANVPDAYFRGVNVDATRILLEASCDAGVARFVYGRGHSSCLTASSTCCYHAHVARRTRS